MDWKKFSTMDSTYNDLLSVTHDNRRMDSKPADSSAMWHTKKQPVNKRLGLLPSAFPPRRASTHLTNFLTEFSDWSQRSEIQVFDDHLPLFRSGLFPDVPGCLVGTLKVSTGHDDPCLELQQLAGKSPPYAAVSPGDDDRLSAHGVSGIPEQLSRSLLREQTTQKKQHPAADNSGYQHRGGHESRDRWQALKIAQQCRVGPSYNTDPEKLISTKKRKL